MNRTILHEAVKCGNADVVKLLIIRGANINVKDHMNRTILHEAVKCGNADVVKLLIIRGANINVKDHMNRTILHEAVRCGNVDVIKLLLTKGAYVHAVDANGRTPLHEASQRTDRQIVELLIAYGATVSAKDKDGRTPLHEAIAEGLKDMSVVEALIDNGAEIDVHDNTGRTPLLDSMKNEWMGECVATHVGHCNDVLEVQDNNGRTALFDAAQNNLTTVFSILMHKGASIYAEDKNGRTVFHEAVKNRSIAIAKIMLDRSSLHTCFNIDINGRLALHEAADNHDIEMMELLSSRGVASVVTTDKSYFTARIPLIEALETTVYQLVRLVVEGGADITCTYSCANTVLHKCIYLQEEKEVNMWQIIRYLIDKGAAVGAKNSAGHTALTCAVRSGYYTSSRHLKSYIIESMKQLIEPEFIISSRPYIDLIKLWTTAKNHETKYQLLRCLFDYASEGEVLQFLVDHRPDDLNSRDHFGKTFIHIACQRLHVTIVDLLIKFGADLNAEDNLRNSPLHDVCRKEHNIFVSDKYRAKIAKLEAGGVINAMNSKNAAPLHEGVMLRDAGIVRYLIDNGANVNLKDDNGTTPLHNAVKSGYIDVAEILVHAGADINALDTSKSTPLHEAISTGAGDYESVVGLLIEHGADINARDENNTTPLHNAAKLTKYTGITKSLINCGGDIKCRDRENRVPLHYICQKAIPPNLADVRDFEELFNLFLEHGNDVNARDRNERTPLHEAAMYGEERHLKWLVKHGADPLARDCYGNTPVYYALQRANRGGLLPYGREEWLLPWKQGLCVDSFKILPRKRFRGPGPFIPRQEHLLITKLKEYKASEHNALHRIVQCGCGINRERKLDEFLREWFARKQQQRFHALLYLMSAGIFPNVAAFTEMIVNFRQYRLLGQSNSVLKKYDNLIAECMGRLNEVRPLKTMCRDSVRQTLYHVSRRKEIMSIIDSMSDIPPVIKSFLSLDGLECILSQTIDPDEGDWSYLEKKR